MRTEAARLSITVLGLILISGLPNALEYTESSTGLIPPSMEGGRTELEFADINADGNVDLMSIGDHGSPYVNTDQHGIMVWFGDGLGNWSVFQNGNFGYGGIAIGDVNGDGLLDVGYAMHHNYSGVDFGNQLIEVALGDGTGMNWTPWDDGLATNGEDWGMFGTDFADVDNDGDLDLGSNAFGCCAGVHVYLNHMDGTWSQSWGFVAGNSSMDFMFGDIDNDGNVDLAVKHQNGTVYFGDGTGNFVNGDANLPSYSYRGTSLGDVDNDGGLDLAFLNSEAPEVWAWDDGSELWVDVSGTLPTTGGYGATALHDMDVDGFIDLVAFGDGIVSVWLGDGAGNWTADATFALPLGGSHEAFRVGGDFDRNGFPDMALVAEEGSWPSYHNRIRCYRETSIATALTIAPVFPRGHEHIVGGSVQFIDWVSAVPVGTATTVALDYSTNGPSGPWTAIAAGLPNNGRHQWAMPAVNSNDCYVRYTVSDGREEEVAVTPAAFTILGEEVGIEEASGSRLALSVRPNPATGATTVHCTLDSPGRVVLAIYDASGRRVVKLTEFIAGRAGEHSFTWNGRDDSGESVAAGVYFCRLETHGEVATRKIVLIR